MLVGVVGGRCVWWVWFMTGMWVGVMVGDLEPPSRLVALQDGPQVKVNQDTRLDNRIIDLRVSAENTSLQRAVYSQLQLIKIWLVRRDTFLPP